MPKAKTILDKVTIADVERLFSKLQMEDCWLWTGAVNTAGYGFFNIWLKYRGVLLPHRVMYTLYNGEIGSTRVLDHLCREKRCVNPKHLEAVTNRENIIRGISPPALHARKTHCLKGHEYTPENTALNIGQGYRKRVCKTCARNTQSAIYHAQRMAKGGATT